MSLVAGAFATAYILEAAALIAFFRGQRIRLFSMYGFALATIFVVNYVGGAFFASAAVREYFFATMGYPYPSLSPTPSTSRFSYTPKHT